MMVIKCEYVLSACVEGKEEGTEVREVVSKGVGGWKGDVFVLWSMVYSFNFCLCVCQVKGSNSNLQSQSQAPSYI